MIYPKFLCAAMWIATTVMAIVACSSDDEKFKSVSPRFSKITLTNLNTSEGSLQAGQPFVATAVQSSKGRLLNSTQYKWHIEDTDNVSHKYTSGIIYDHQPENPSDTILISHPGRYELVFTADYNISGVATGANLTESLTNGGTATYQVSTLKYKVKLTKFIVVH